MAGLLGIKIGQGTPRFDVFVAVPVVARITDATIFPRDGLVEVSGVCHPSLGSFRVFGSSYGGNGEPRERIAFQVEDSKSSDTLRRFTSRGRVPKNFCGHGNSKSDAFFVAGPARGSQPLGEYCVRSAIHRDHDSGDPAWLAFLYYLRIDRNRAECTYRLVRMDLAEASGTLTLQTFFFRSNISRPRRLTELNNVTQMASRTLAENSRFNHDPSTYLILQGCLESPNIQKHSLCWLILGSAFERKKAVFCIP
jgi:hypothetical protein